MMMHPESSTSSNSGANSSNKSPDRKVLKDLSALSEQITLCQSMLRPEDGSKVDVDSNEALLAVIGFLEACVPRMVQLVEAGAQGVLKEDTMVKCLEVNDVLCKTLEDLDHPERMESVPSVAAARPAGNVDLDDLLSDDYKSNDPFKFGGQQPPSAGDDKKKSSLNELLETGGTGQQKKDDFDDFFGDRMSGKI